MADIFKILFITYIEPKNRMVRPIANPFHNGGSVSRIVAVAQSLSQCLGVDHDSVIGMVSVDGHFDVVENDRMVRYAERWACRIFFNLGQYFPIRLKHFMLEP